MDLSPAHPYSLFFANLIGSMPPEYMQKQIEIFPVEEGMIGHIGAMTVSFFPQGEGWVAGITANGEETEVTGNDVTALAARIADQIPSTRIASDKKDEINRAARDWLTGVIAMLETEVLLQGLEVNTVVNNREAWVISTPLTDSPWVSGFRRSTEPGKAWECDETVGNDPVEMGAYTAFAFNEDFEPVLPRKEAAYE